MPEYNYEDLVGGNAPVSVEDPITRALNAIASLGATPAPAPAQEDNPVTRADFHTWVPAQLTTEMPEEKVTPLPRELPADLPPEYAPRPIQYTPPNQPRNVAEATKAEDYQLVHTAYSREKYLEAKLAADTERANRTASASERAANEQLQLGIQHQRTMEMLNAKADAETANWLTDLTNKGKEEPTPGRWWDSQSGLGKALWALSLVFGAGYAAITPGAKNTALDMVRQEISDDMARQDQRLKREVSIMELKGTVMQRRQDRNLSDEHDRYGRELSRLQSLERAWIARAGVPGAADQDAARAEAQAWFEQNKLGIMSGYRSEQVQSAARQEGYRHAESMQTAAQNFQADQARIQRDWQMTHDLALSDVKASAKFGTNAQGLPVDEHGIPLLSEAQTGVGTNVVIKNPKTGQLAVTPFAPNAEPGVARFRPSDNENRQKFEEAKDLNDKRYQIMTRLAKAMDAKSGGKVVASIGVKELDPEIEADIKLLGGMNAKALNSRVSNFEFQQGIGQLTGFNPDGNLLERGKVAANWGAIRARLRRDLDNLKPQAEADLTKFLDKSIVGDAHAVWNPADLESPKPTERSQLQKLDQPPLTLQDRPVTGKADYEQRAGLEAGDPSRVGQELPDHDQDAVRSVEAEAENSGSPAVIKRQADKVILEAQRTIDRLSTAAGLPGLPSNQPGELGTSTVPGRELTPEEEAEVRRARNTQDIVRAVATDEYKQATATLKRFEKWAASLPPDLQAQSPEWKREQAVKKFGIKGAPKEVGEILDRLKSLSEGERNKRAMEE